ncbi:hypothetical protein GKN89_11615 [Serratia sp. YC16]|nr:hypothetical protein [Serratia sp. YC16]MTD07375.1 hypothetical protein [Serratia sp. YC16]
MMIITQEQVARRRQLNAIGTFKMHSRLAGENWEYPGAGDVDAPPD